MTDPSVPDPGTILPTEPIPPGGPVPSRPPRRGWWGRNWFWVVPVGCLVPLVCCCGVPGLITVGVMSGIRASDPYKEGVARAKQSPAVQEALGSPVQESVFVAGNLKVENDTGEADLTVSLSGPKGAGTLHVVGTKKGGQWTYTTMEVDVTGSGARIDLLGKESPKGE